MVSKSDDATTLEDRVNQGVKIEDYIQTLPKNVMSGKDVDLHGKSLREMFNLAGLCPDDIMYHLGCGGSAESLKIALDEFGVKKAVGIDLDPKKIASVKKVMREKQQKGEWDVICMDLKDVDVSEATVIIFWFVDAEIVDTMTKRFEVLNPGIRILTIWGPLPGCLPQRVDFPYILNKTPLKKALDIKEQVHAVFGVKCVDFVTAWEYAERYTKALGMPDVENDRFLTIIQTLTIWINAWNLGVACGDGIPEPITTYIKLMKMNFGIEFEHMLKNNILYE